MVPLTVGMIEAAGRIHNGLEQWRLSDSVLTSLGLNYPNFDEASCLLKTIAINTLYGTQIYAVIPLARHIARELPSAARGPELVTQLAKYPGGRANVSFAAKFCHFFVDEKTFHIYDDRACRALRHHLGKVYQENEADRYVAFCNNLARLRDAFRIDAKSRSLDHYLWLTGSWIKWKKAGAINAELQALFARKPRPLDLNEMLPDDLS